MAAGALILTLASIATSIGVLAGSDNRPITEWRFQPTVYLAIVTTVANVCLHYAFAQSVTIAWWRTSLRGTTINELHRTYQYGNDFLAALLGLRHLSLISIACLLVTISPINGPLMQRASQITTRGGATQTTLKLSMAEEFPFGYTSWSSGRSESVSMMTQEFVPLLQQWTLQTPILMRNACRGRCTGNLRGAGFALNCTQSTLTFNTTIPYNATPDQYYPSSTYFDIALGHNYGQPGNAQNLNVVFKNTTECSGVLQVQNCTLQPAVVEYPVVVDGGGQTIALQGASTIWDDVVISTTPFEGTYYRRNTYGGLWKAMSERYTASAFFEAEPVIISTVISNGFAANQYGIVQPQGGDGGGLNCTLSFMNPMPDMLQAARDLSFRTAVNVANASTSQNIVVTETANEPHFHSDYLFLGLALLVTILPVLLVATVFHGFWHIGRKVTLSPIEVAKAFDAPGLRSTDSNATARALVGEIGERQVKYGGAAPGIYPGEASEDIVTDTEISDEADRGARLRLQLRSPDHVISPQPGWRFIG